MKHWRHFQLNYDHQVKTESYDSFLNRKQSDDFSLNINEKKSLNGSVLRFKYIFSVDACLSRVLLLGSPLVINVTDCSPKRTPGDRTSYG